MLLARYDRDVALALARAAETWCAENAGRPGNPWYNIKPLRAWVAADPRSAAARIDNLPDKFFHREFSPQKEAALEAAAILTRFDEARWRYFLGNYLNLWVPDTEDFFNE
jgi:hypothetical protein